MIAKSRGNGTSLKPEPGFTGDGPRGSACRILVSGQRLVRGLIPVTPAQLLLQRLLPLGILALALVSVPWMMLAPTGLHRLDSLQEEKRGTDEEIARLSLEIEQLRAQVRRIKDDPAAVEQVARDELGLVRQTEVVFQFKE